MKNGRYAIEEQLDVETRSAVEKGRLEELCNATCRCGDKKLRVPNEWLREMRDLIDSILTTRVEE